MLCLPAATEGAENRAMLASLIETCKLHDVNPEAYLTDVLTKLANNWPNNRLAELTPHRPTAANQSAPRRSISGIVPPARASAEKMSTAEETV
jgi:hypothetical protein